MGAAPVEAAVANPRAALEAALVNEAARLLGAQVVQRASDIDVVMVRGFGFDPRRGGPLFQADVTGLLSILNDLKRLASVSASLWQPHEMIETMVKNGTALAGKAEPRAWVHREYEEIGQEPGREAADLLFRRLEPSGQQNADHHQHQPGHRQKKRAGIHRNHLLQLGAQGVVIQAGLACLPDGDDAPDQSRPDRAATRRHLSRQELPWVRSFGFCARRALRAPIGTPPKLQAAGA